MALRDLLEDKVITKIRKLDDDQLVRLARFLDGEEVVVSEASTADTMTDGPPLEGAEVPIEPEAAWRGRL